MEQKQGKEKLKIIKDEDDNTRKYIFKNNRITLIAIAVTVFFLAILIIALIVSGEAFT